MLLAVSAMAIPAITVAAIDANLKYGARGTEVAELQEFLIDKGFLSGTATGNFYSLTRKAVVAYQTSAGLPTTGFVGPMTRNVINQELAGNTSTQAEVTETGTTTPAIAESPIDLLKKQIALLMQQMQVLQGQATTQNQILQNQQTQQAAQNQQAQQTQQQLGQIITNTTPPATPASTPTPQPIPTSVPKISSVVLGFYNQPGADVVINYLEFTSDQDIVCHSGNLAGGVAAGVTTKHCVIEGDNAEAKLRAHLSECNTTRDKGFYIFSTNQQVDPTKIYSCNITVQNNNGTSVNYKHTFSIPN